MLRFIRNKVIAWFKTQITKDEFRSGYEWAKAYIDEGKIAEIEALTYSVHEPFDRGAMKAVREAKYTKRSSLDELI